MVRGDWAIEFNRTPWVGCPPDVGCNDKRTCGGENCPGGCAEGCAESGNTKQGFRRHCGLHQGCTAERPCCKTLGCGMWVDSSDPNSFAALGTTVKACGLTPFCSPMKPCGLTPNCGRIDPVAVQSLMLQNAILQRGSVQNGAQNDPQNGVQRPGQTPQQTPSPSLLQTPPPPQTTPTNAPVAVGIPNNLLITKGIVPGVSAIQGGGLVAAAGVSTPVGVMTPSGVQLANGTLQPGAVIRVCASHPGCTPAHPCGRIPGCGGAVPLTLVSNNAVALASTMTQQGMASGVIPAGGGSASAGKIPVIRTSSGTLVHAVTGQTMSPEAVRALVAQQNRIGAATRLNNYPPIGFAQEGYSPNARYAELGWTRDDEEAEEPEPVAERAAALPGARSNMPLPNFHRVPTKPVFQRSEGLPVFPDEILPDEVLPDKENVSMRSLSSNRTSASNINQRLSEVDMAAAVEEAYLEGMSYAMSEVSAELDQSSQERSRELAKAEKKAAILEQAQKLEARLQQQKKMELQAQELAQRQERQREIAQIQEERREKLLAKEEALLRQRENLSALEHDLLAQELEEPKMLHEPVRPRNPQRAAEPAPELNEYPVLAAAHYNDDGNNRAQNRAQQMTLSMQTPYQNVLTETAGTAARQKTGALRTMPPSSQSIQQVAHASPAQNLSPPKKAGQLVKKWGSHLVGSVSDSVENSVDWLKKVHRQPADCGVSANSQSVDARSHVAFQPRDQQAAMTSRLVPNIATKSAATTSQLLPSRPRTFQDVTSPGIASQNRVKQASY